MTKNSSKPFLAIALFLASCFVGCGGGTGTTNGGGGGTGTSSGIAQLTITMPRGDSSHAPIPVGEKVQLTATADLDDGADVNDTDVVTWVSSNTAVATITKDGLVTMLQPGAVTMTASKSGKSADVHLTGTAAVLQSIAVTPSPASVPLGATKQFTATGTYTDGSTRNLSSATWASSSTDVASVDNSGLTQSHATGTTTITATSGSLNGQATLTVTPRAVTSVAVSPSTASIPLGKTQQFTATATYSDGTTANVTNSVTWGATPLSVLAIDSTGLAHSISLGNFTITATINEQSTDISGTVANPIATGLQITPISISIPTLSTQAFHATVTLSNGATQDVTASVTWQSSNPLVASVSATGVVTAVAAGSADITGTYQALSATASISISNATAQSVNITASGASIAKGTALQLTATATLSDGSTQNVTSSAAWSSSMTAVATVNAAGVVTAITPGSTTISAQFGGKTGSFNLTITAATLVSITITPLNPTVASGGALQLQATGTFSDGSTQNITGSLTFSSSNSSVATVSSSGVIQGVSPGTANITASEGSVSVTFPVVISSAVLQGITVTPASPTLIVGSTQQFTATGQFSDGSTQDMTATVTWNSSAPLVASINAQGLVDGLAAGSVSISSTSGSITGSTSLTISAATITTVTVSPLNATIAAGQTQAFTATATLSDSSTQDVTGSAHWAVSNAAVAQISNNTGSAGTVSGVAAGTTQVTATISGVTGIANLTVTAATVVSVSVNPANVSIALGVPTPLTATATYSDGSTANVSGTVQWQSSNGSVASVAGGLVIPLTQGSSTISATLQGQTGSAAVTVTAATLSSIAITPTTISLALGMTTQLAAIGTFSDSSTQDITSMVHWTSSLASVATVGATGLVVSIAPGSSTITASLNGVSETAAVTISPATLQSITVSAAQTSLALGFTLQLTATGNYSDGSTQNLTSSVQWSSTNGSIGVVSAAGMLSGVAAGSLTANATLQGVTGTLGLTITPATLQSITISPSGSLSWLLSQQLTLTGHFSDGSTQVISAGVHWSVSNTLFATINQLGLLLPLSLGNITVTATYGSLTAQVSISLV